MLGSNATSRGLWWLLLPPLILSAAHYRFIISSYRTADLADRRLEFVTGLDAVLSTLKDAETAQRGFLLTGNQRYLEPYERAVREIPAILSHAKAAATRENTRPALSEVEGMTAAKLDELRRTLELAKAGDQRTAIRIVSSASEEGKSLMDRLRVAIAGLQETEKAFLEKDLAHRERLRARVQILLFSIPLLTAIFIWRLVTIAQRNAQLRDDKERDLEELNRTLERRVEERTAALQTTNRDLEEFARTAAHDLKSPVRTAFGMAQLLQRRFEGRLPEEASHMLRMVVEAIERLASLVDDLLTYLRLGVSEVSAHRAVDLGKVVSQAEAGMRSALAEAAGTVRSANLPHVIGDETQLTRLFQNLLENAVKYRKEREAPVIDIAASRRDNKWVIAVQDNGIGFDPQYAQSIFQPFRRLHGPEVPGSGIGLALCARIAERCGGRIWAESSEQRGAAFYVELLDAATPPENERAYAASAQHSL